MKTSIDWIDEAEKRLGLSDYAMAKRLGVSTAQMSRYRTGQRFLGDDVAVRLAELLGVDPLPILAAAAAERATTDTARAAWARYAEGMATFTGAMVLGTLLSAPIDARASTAQAQSSDPGLYIMSTKRQRKRTRADQDTRSKPGLIPGFFTSGLFPAFP